MGNKHEHTPDSGRKEPQQRPDTSSGSPKIDVEKLIFGGSGSDAHQGQLPQDDRSHFQSLNSPHLWQKLGMGTTLAEKGANGSDEEKGKAPRNSTETVPETAPTEHLGDQGPVIEAKKDGVSSDLTDTIKPSSGSLSGVVSDTATPPVKEAADKNGPKRRDSGVVLPDTPEDIAYFTRALENVQDWLHKKQRPEIPDVSDMKGFSREVQEHFQLVEQLHECAVWYYQKFLGIDESLWKPVVEDATQKLKNLASEDPQYARLQKKMALESRLSSVGESSLDDLSTKLEKPEVEYLQAFRSRIERDPGDIPSKSDFIKCDQILRRHDYGLGERGPHELYHRAWLNMMCSELYPPVADRSQYAVDLQRRFKVRYPDRKYTEMTDMDYQQFRFIEHNQPGFVIGSTKERVGLTAEMMTTYLQPSSQTSPFTFSLPGATRIEESAARQVIANIRRELGSGGDDDWGVDDAKSKKVIDKHIERFYQYAEDRFSLNVMFHLLDEKHDRGRHDSGKKALLDRLNKRYIGVANIEKTDVDFLKAFNRERYLLSGGHDDLKSQFITPQRIIQMRERNVDEGVRREYSGEFGLSEQASQALCDLLTEFKAMKESDWQKAKDNPLYIMRAFNYKIMEFMYNRKYAIHVNAVVKVGNPERIMSDASAKLTDAWAMYKKSGEELNLPFPPHASHEVELVKKES